MFRKVIGAAAVAAMIGCTAEDADPRFTDLTGEEPGAVSVGNEQPLVPVLHRTSRALVTTSIPMIALTVSITRMAPTRAIYRTSRPTHPVWRAEPSTIRASR